MTQAYTNLISTLALVRRGWVVRRVIEGAVLLVAICVTTWLLAAAMDQMWDPGTIGRWMLFTMQFFVFGFAAAKFLVLPVRTRYSDDYYASLIESRHPHFSNRLINAIQLGRDPSPQAPRLVTAIIEQAALLTEQIDISIAVASPVLRQRAKWLLLSALSMTAYLLIAGPGAQASVQRVVLPWADIPSFTWTTLNIEPASDITVLEGTPLEIRATTGGQRPSEEASLILIDGRGIKRSVAMSPYGDRSFIYTFPAVQAPLTYYGIAGDARSRHVKIRVEPRPRITAMNVVYHYPAYTDLEPRSGNKLDGNINALPGTKADVRIEINKSLRRATLTLDGEPALEMKLESADSSAWTTSLTLTRAAEYRITLTDMPGNEVEAGRFTISLDADQSPQISFAKPGRDAQVAPDASLPLAIIVQDDFGIGPVMLLGKINPDSPNPRTTAIQNWPATGPPQKRVDLTLDIGAAKLGLKPGDVLEYWATVEDRNNIAVRPGFAESRHYLLHILTADQMRAINETQLTEYARALTELIRLQRLNRNEADGRAPAGPLVERQALIRQSTRQLADVMESRAFVIKTMISELRDLAAGDMAAVLALLETSRDTHNITTAGDFTQRTLPSQDKIIGTLEDMLRRITRDLTIRDNLKKMEKNEPEEHKQVTTALTKLARDLDRFLAEQRDIKEQHERMAKRDDNDEAKGESSDKPRDAEHRLDRWKQWLKDNVDGLAKLPEGFVKDSDLSETLPAIFEEVEKMQRNPTTEIATPLEEGAKILSTKVLEDLEVWMMAKGDSANFVMEEGMEGKFEVQPSPLPSNLQDMVGDLIEDLEEFDENADDATSTWGGDTAQAGWDIADGPISSFSATGKTGNQMPNSSEITGRSGSGRRGRSSGQMVGDEAKAMEGRPTPARVSNERYESGQPKSPKQLDPRGATGGGKKTGGGTRGLQGGTPPDFSREMDRLRENQAMLRERAQQVARQLDALGNPSARVERALQLLNASEEDMRDMRYDDAARKRKTAIQELKSDQLHIDEAVSLSLQKARDIPPDMREQINAGARQALPEGFEELVGAYYKALSNSSDSSATPETKSK